MRLGIQFAFIVCLSGFVAAQQPTTFDTPPPKSPPQTKPKNELRIVDGPRVEAVTDTTAQVAWSTDVEASAAVRYGTDKSKLEQHAEQPWGGYKTQRSAVHRVQLKNLKPNTTYYFAVESGQGWNKSKNVARSDIQSLTTKPAGTVSSSSTAPQVAVIQPGNILAGPLAADVSEKSAVIWWMTKDESEASIRFAKHGEKPDKTQPAPGGTIKKVTLHDLQPATGYDYEVLDATKKPVFKGSFRTEPPDFVAAKFKITSGPSIEVLGQESAVISWSTNARSSSVVRYGIKPDQLDQEVLAPWGQQRHRVTVRNLKPDTRYYFVVESSQAEGSGLAVKSQVAPLRTVGEGQSAMRNPDWQ